MLYLSIFIVPFIYNYNIVLIPRLINTGTLTYCAGVFISCVMGKYWLSYRCTATRVTSVDIERPKMGRCSCSDVSGTPRFVSHTIMRLSSDPDKATEPSPLSLTHVTWPKWPVSRCLSSPVCMSHMIKLASHEPDTTIDLSLMATATHVTWSSCPTNTYGVRTRICVIYSVFTWCGSEWVDGWEMDRFYEI